jgi:hypothetical protein
MQTRTATPARAHRWRLTGAAVSLSCALAVLATLCMLPVAAAALGHTAAPATLPRGCGVTMATGRVAAASVPGYATRAQISLNTASAVAGTQIVVRGTGWPGGVPMTIGVEHFIQTDGFVNAFDGLVQATASATGTFTSPMFLLPGGTCAILPRAGTTAEIVAHTPGGGVHASAALSIVQTPTITVGLPQLTLPRAATAIPVSGSVWVPGTSVSLVAAGFPSDCHVATANDSVRCVTPLSDAQPDIAVAEADGRFGINVPIPPGVLPGRW